MQDKFRKATREEVLGVLGVLQRWQKDGDYSIDEATRDLRAALAAPPEPAFKEFADRLSTACHESIDRLPETLLKRDAKGRPWADAIDPFIDIIGDLYRAAALSHGAPEKG